MLCIPILGASLGLLHFLIPRFPKRESERIIVVLHFQISNPLLEQIIASLDLIPRDLNFRDSSRCWDRGAAPNL